MLNGIPFGCAGGVVADRDLDLIGLSEIVPEMIEPCGIGRSVAAAVISKDENAASMRVAWGSIPFPPGADGVDGEGRGIMAETEKDSALVRDSVEDAVGGTFA